MSPDAPEGLEVFILFHRIVNMKTLSIVPIGISTSLGIPNRLGDNSWSTASRTTYAQ
jgi:hypothetical protein